MYFDHIPALVSSLADSAVGTFVLAVTIDTALGVVVALKSKTFDVHKLGDFLLSQYGTRQALVLVGLVIAAALAQGSSQQAISAALTAGAAALTVSVLKDAYDKIRTLAA